MEPILARVMKNELFRVVFLCNCSLLVFMGRVYSPVMTFFSIKVKGEEILTKKDVPLIYTINVKVVFFTVR